MSAKHGQEWGWRGGGKRRKDERKRRTYSRQGRRGKIDILIGQNNWNERTNERS